MPPLASLPTPALLLDRTILERNIASMASKARRLGVKLRPHIKTHKCVEIGRLQRDAGAQGITVATIVEAESFAAAGFDDITWAVPLPLSRLPEVIALARRVTFRVLVDSQPAAEALDRAARAAGVRVHVFLEVDCGDHRSGVDPSRAQSVELARRLVKAGGLVFDGILTHGGHSYHAANLEELIRAARQERDVMVRFADLLRGEGLPVETVSIGSTPGMAVHESLRGIDEVRPGSYVFHDYMQAAASVCSPDDVAVSVLASVISHQPGAGRVIVDAGALSMSKDLGPGAASGAARGFGPLYAGATGSALDSCVSLVAVSQEHGFVAGRSPADVEGRFAVGELVRIMPNHCCLTAAMFDRYEVVAGGEVTDRWSILRGR